MPRFHSPNRAPPNGAAHNATFHLTKRSGTSPATLGADGLLPERLVREFSCSRGDRLGAARRDGTTVAHKGGTVRLGSLLRLAFVRLMLAQVLLDLLHYGYGFGDYDDYGACRAGG